VKDTGSPKLLFENLDLTPIKDTLWKDLHREGPGRPVEYDPEADLRALMLKLLLHVPYMKDLVKRLRRSPRLRRICGYRDKAPSEGHFSQMKKRVTKQGFMKIESWMRKEALRVRTSQPLAAVGLIQAAGIDGTDIQAWSSRDPHDTRRGRGDPDARVGRNKSGGFDLGYLSLMMADIEGFPLGHVEASLNVNEKRLVEPLLDKVLGEDIEVELLAADSQHESRNIFDALEARKIDHLIAWRRLKGRVNPQGVLTVKDRIDVEGPQWKRVQYKRLRAMSESINGRVKTRAAFKLFTWKGLDNACIHVSLVFCLLYAVCIAAHRMGRPELRQSLAFFA